MKIHISRGEDYMVKEATITLFFASILAYILNEYEKLPDHLKLLAMALTRGILLFSEMKEADAEKKKLLRPEKRGDPNVHLIRLLVGRLAAVMPGVEIEVQTDEDRNITACYLKNSDPGGRQIFVDGGQRQRQNDSSQITGQASGEALSNAQTLHT